MQPNSLSFLYALGLAVLLTLTYSLIVRFIIEARMNGKKRRNMRHRADGLSIISKMLKKAMALCRQLEKARDEAIANTRILDRLLEENIAALRNREVYISAGELRLKELGL